MAAIDYTIPGQVKSVEIESPMNAMARAMQLRGMQEASQLNALKMQEYQQDVMEKNELAKIYANPDLKPGSQEFFNEIYRRAPRAADKLATAEVQRQLALSTQATREQQRQEAEQKQRLAKREFGLRKIAGAKDYQSAVSLIERGVRTGEVDREEANDMLYELHATGPNTDMAAFRSNVLTNLLPADKALTAPYDIRKAQAGANEEEQKLAAANLDFETKQLDARRKQFDSVYPPNLIKSPEDVKNRILLQASDPALKQLLTRFGTLEEIIARDVAEFGRDPLGYKKRLAGVPTADILKAAEEKEDREYSQYKLIEILNRRTPLMQEDYFKKKRGEVAAPVAAAADGAAPVAAAADGTAAPVAAAADGTAAPVAAAASKEKGEPVGTPVTVEANVYGVELLDPDAQAMYAAAAAEKNPVVKDVYLKLGDKIQTESAARASNKRYTGTFQNVDVALRELEQLKKEQPLTEENATRIKVLEQLVATAQLGPPQALRPPAPTEITKKEDELEALERSLAAETDPDKKKKLRERIKRLKADINADVHGRPPVVAVPTLSASALDMNAERFLVDGTLPPGISKANRDAIMNRAAVIAKDKGMSVDRVAQLEVTANKSALAQLSRTETMVGAFEKNFIKNVRIVENLNSKRDSTGVPLLQKWINVGKKAVTGDPDLAALNIAIKAVVNEYGKIVSGSMGNTAIAVSEIKRMEDLLNSAQNPADVVAVLNTMKAETQNRMAGFNEQRAELTGAMRKSTAAPKSTGTVDKNNKWLK